MDKPFPLPPLLTDGVVGLEEYVPNQSRLAHGSSEDAPQLRPVHQISVGQASQGSSQHSSDSPRAPSQDRDRGPQSKPSAADASGQEPSPAGPSSSRSPRSSGEVELEAESPTAPTESRRRTLRRQLRELRSRRRAQRREVERLCVDYDEEVERSADIRAALDERDEIFEESLGPLRAELREAEVAIEANEHLDAWSSMGTEDALGRGARLLEARSREIAFLERRYRQLEQSHQNLKEDDQPMDTAMEEAVKAADRESSELQEEVEAREKRIACLTSDLKSALEYMMNVNVEVAGGPSKVLVADDFLPADVRNHLGLSEHGQSHLAMLTKKFLLLMADAEPTGRPVPDVAGAGPGPLANDKFLNGPGHPPSQAVQDQRSARRLAPVGLVNLPGVPRVPLAAPAHPPEVPTQLLVIAQQKSRQPISPQPLAAVGLEEEDDLWASIDDPPALPTHDSLPAADLEVSLGQAAPLEAAKMETFDEEARLLRKTLEDDLCQLRELISDAPSLEGREQVELLRAAAQGDVVAMRERLPPVEGGELLGWTAWHVAAAYGQPAALECLKDDSFERSEHLLWAMTQPTASGLSPLAVACLRGQVEAARSLLRGMAPVDARDTRGNTPLHWALACDVSQHLVPLLLEAQADPSAANCSGHRAKELLEPLDAVGRGLPSGLAEALEPAPMPDASLDAQSAEACEGLAVAEDFVEPCRCIRTIGGSPAEDSGLFEGVLSMLKAPARDHVGFAKNEKGKSLAKLSREEADSGVWSGWVTNYTHAGLQQSLDTASFSTSADPSSPERSRQAIVLTSERVLFFNARTWSLSLVMALSEIAELIVFSHSASLLVLRMHRVNDVVLDVTQRARLLDEIELATRRVAAKWGGSDFGQNKVQVHHETEALAGLLDEKRHRVGTIAFVEAEVFMLLPYVPQALLLRDAFFFGFLDLHQSSGEQKALRWSWQVRFFILKSGAKASRQLCWCRHPADQESEGSLHIDQIQGVQPTDTPQGDICLILAYEGPNGPEAVTLRAHTLQNRDEWIDSIRAVQNT